jgi:hypothetical protein
VNGVRAALCVLSAFAVACRIGRVRVSMTDIMRTAVRI